MVCSHQFVPKALDRNQTKSSACRWSAIRYTHLPLYPQSSICGRRSKHGRSRGGANRFVVFDVRGRELRAETRQLFSRTIYSTRRDWVKHVTRNKGRVKPDDEFAWPLILGFRRAGATKIDCGKRESGGVNACADESCSKIC